MLRFLDRINSFTDRINSFTPVLTGAIFFTIMIVMVREVFGRYLFHSPFIFAQDINIQLLLLATFWGASYVVSVRGFPTVDLFYRKFSPVKQSVVDLIAYLGGVTFLLALTWQIVELAIEAIVLTTRTSPPARIPMIIPYSAMLIGLFFFVLQTCRHIFSLSAFLARSLRRQT